MNVPLQHETSAHVMQPHLLAHRGAYTGEHRSGCAEEEGAGEPRECWRNAAERRAAHPPDDELDQRAEEAEPEVLRDGPTLEPGGRDGADRQCAGEHDFDARGGGGARPPRHEREQEAATKAGEKSFDLRQRMEDAPVLLGDAEREEQPVEHACPRQQRAERKEHAKWLAPPQWSRLRSPHAKGRARRVAAASPSPLLSVDRIELSWATGSSRYHRGSFAAMSAARAEQGMRHLFRWSREWRSSPLSHASRTASQLQPSRTAACRTSSGRAPSWNTCGTRTLLMVGDRW